MILAYDYPLLGLFWSMLIFFLWIAWLIILFRVFVDIFRSHDMGGFSKALWSIFVLILPFLGVFIYLIARGDQMSKNDIAAAQAHDAAFQAYVKQAAGSSGPADQLAQLAALREAGQITDEEYAAGKAKILA